MPTLAKNSIQSNQIFIENFWRASLVRTLIRIQLELDQILIRLWSDLNKTFQVDDQLPSVSFANSHSAGDSPSETVRVGDNFWRLDLQNNLTNVFDDSNMIFKMNKLLLVMMNITSLSLCWCFYDEILLWWRIDEKRHDWICWRFKTKIPFQFLHLSATENLLKLRNFCLIRSGGSSEGGGTLLTMRPSQGRFRIMFYYFSCMFGPEVLQILGAFKV